MPIFRTLALDLGKFGAGDVHKNVLSDYVIRESWLSESRTVLGSVNELVFSPSVLSNVDKIGVRELHIRQFSILVSVKIGTG